MSTFEIFRTGVHNGRTFSADHLAEIVAAYNPSIDEAPIVKGHSVRYDDTAEVYGWVDALELRGESIWATARALDPDFVEQVRAQKLRKVSAGFDVISGDDSIEHFRLHHVAFVPVPAVKGLTPPQFAENHRLIIGADFSFCGECFAASAEIINTVRETDMGEFVEVGFLDKILGKGGSDFALAKQSIADLTAKVATLEADNARKDLELAAINARHERSELIAFCEASMAESGKTFSPAARKSVLDLAAKMQPGAVGKDAMQSYIAAIPALREDLSLVTTARADGDAADVEVDNAWSKLVAPRLKHSIAAAAAKRGIDFAHAEAEAKGIWLAKYPSEQAAVDEAVAVYGGTSDGR
jgi:hypothetical protein